MNTYILRIHWDSEKKAKDLDHLRKWLADLYKGDTVKVDVYLKTEKGKRFLGQFGKYNGKAVWYSHVPSIVNDYRLIDPKTGKLI